MTAQGVIRCNDTQNVQRQIDIVKLTWCKADEIINIGKFALS